MLSDYKYPTKEQIKGASLRILTKFQSEKIKLVTESNEWDLLFENGILSAVSYLYIMIVINYTSNFLIFFNR